MADRRKRVIPSVPKSSLGTDRAPFDTAVKQVLDVLTGTVGEEEFAPIETLPLTAGLGDVIDMLNRVVRRLQ